MYIHIIIYIRIDKPRFSINRDNVSKAAQYGATRADSRGERSGERRTSGYGFSLLKPAPSCPSLSSSYRVGSTSLGPVVVGFWVSCLQAALLEMPLDKPFSVAVPFGIVP